MSGAHQAKKASTESADQAAVLEGVKSAEVRAKAKLQEAMAQAEAIRSEARSGADRTVRDAEDQAARLRQETIQAGMKETEKEVQRIRTEAAEAADKIRRQKEKKVDAEGILHSILDS